MSKRDLQPRRDRLVDQYREIGPAVLVAALMSGVRRGTTNNNGNRRPSILTVKKPT